MKTIKNQWKERFFRYTMYISLGIVFAGIGFVMATVLLTNEPKGEVVICELEKNQMCCCIDYVKKEKSND